MGSRPGYLGRSSAAVSAGILVALVAAAYALARAGLSREYVALAVPLLLYSAPLLLIWAARLEPGPARPSAGDLDHLLDLKRRGALPPARRPPRRGPRRPVPRATVAADPPASPLDRLVGRKRHGAEPGADPDRTDG
jgi:hypothetical protein